jgi:hypothetical protein
LNHAGIVVIRLGMERHDPGERLQADWQLPKPGDLPGIELLARVGTGRPGATFGNPSVVVATDGRDAGGLQECRG